MCFVLLASTCVTKTEFSASIAWSARQTVTITERSREESIERLSVPSVHDAASAASIPSPRVPLHPTGKSSGFN